MKKSIVIGSRVFRSKNAVLEAVRLVLRMAPLDADLPDNDFIFIRDFAMLHPRQAEKFANGCRAIQVRMNYIPGLPAQRGFWIIGDNDSAIDFSIYAPLQSAEQRARNELIWAARMAITPIVNTFKKNAFGDSLFIPCATTGIPMAWEEAHVDHDKPWPFKLILETWLARRSGPPTLIDRGLYSEFALPEDIADFCTFHNSVANLRVIHHLENIRQQKR